MASFSHRNRLYSASFSSYTNGQKVLVITSPEQVKLYVKATERRAIKKNLQGDEEEIDLQEPNHKEFYEGLIREAQKVAEQEDNERRAESFFNQNVNAEYESQVQDFNKTLNIAVIGNVSSGKSSLINALLMRTRENFVAKVGVTAGVTTELNILRLDERVRLIDSPGLGDIRRENSQITQDFLRNIDIGILVVTGAADASQRQYFDDLRANCNSVFLVLNKCDEWDKYNIQALEDVKEQWKQCLGIDKIYAVCTFGYDPQLPDSIPLDIRGVDRLREDIEFFLESKGKKLLLARHMNDKKPYAVGIIVTAITAIGVQAALPGKAFFITATQSVAITSLYYIYTGRILSKGAVLALLPVFAGQAVATNVFLFISSFIPPTGVIEVAAAITAITITTAMLAAVNFVFSSGVELENKDTDEILKAKFNEYRDLVKAILTKVSLTDIRNLGSLNFRDIIDKLI